ncbi:MAG: trimethylamine methyltransferase family protein [Verrucomicrobia bacterium]|nr:trimethylamine methyltransferase family protein [Verrucomicrobiota bacterium]
MSFPQFAQLLTEAQVQRTHEASLEILQQVGFEVQNGKAREIFKRHGCAVGENSRVTFPPQLVEESLKSIPPQFTFRAHQPEFDRTIPDDAPLTMTASSAPNLIDPVTQGHRLATSEDLARIAHLIDQLPGIDLLSVPTLAADAPPGQESLTRFYTALRYCRKPIRGSAAPGDDAAAILQLAYEIAGSEAAYRERPFITHHHCPVIAPLRMDEHSTGLMIFYTEQGLPNHPTIVPNAGLTSPMTLAGTLAQGNAEFLACATLTQLVRPGTPMIYSTLSTVADVRTGAYAPGGIECGMLNMAHAQMARFYRVPCAGYIGLTNSKLVDAQAGYEKALSCMGGLLAGMHVLQFAGLLEALLTFDFGMAVVDNEISLILKRVARGMEWSEASLALDEIKAVGPSGMFVDTELTLERMKATAFLPDVADRESRETWSKKGGLDTADKALLKARKILESDCPSLFSPEVETRIRQRFQGMVAGDFKVIEGRMPASCAPTAAATRAAMVKRNEGVAA